MNSPALCAGTLVLLASTLAPSAAAPLEKLTVERLHAQPALGGSPPSDLAWHPKGKQLSFLRSSSPGATADLYSLELKSGREERLVRGLGSLLPAAEANGRARYEWSPRSDSVLLTSGGDLLLLDTRNGKRRQLTRTPEEELFADLSPNGKLVAFVRGSDLYVIELASGRETPLTKSGSQTLLNGRLDWVYYEELASRYGKAFEWAPNSRAIAYLQLDQSAVPEFPIVDFLPVHNTAALQRYPKAGDPNSTVRIGLVGLDKKGRPGPVRLLDIEPRDSYVVPKLRFTPDGKTLAFRQLNRAQNELQLQLLTVPKKPEAPLGSAVKVLSEKSDDWVNVLSAPYFVRGGKQFIWHAERTGYAHLYLCDQVGRCRPITRGAWAVEQLIGVDERRGFVFFTGTEKHPRERHLYRTRFDGTGLQRLTEQPGTHRPSLSPKGDFWSDRWSSVSQPTRVAVTSMDRRHHVSLAEDASPPIAGFELGTTEWVDLQAEDGTPLHARLLKPADFDPSRRYPTLVHIYGGPHAQTVRDGWSRSAPFEHLLVSRGFLVWALDNRGSGGRGHVFEAPIHREPGKIELKDHLVGVEHLRSLPYVDGDRLGIWGWSYGGYMTLYAVSRTPEVFKAAVSGAPVTDWRSYDTIYTERYMGTPDDNPDGYARASLLQRAGDIQAELLLIHGTGDDNVHLANTLAFAEALSQAGTPHALSLHPRQKHSFSDRSHRISRDKAILRHFERYLKTDSDQ